MKEFKGTKGPWEVKHSQSKTAYNVVGTVLGGKYKIARCPYLKDENFSDYINDKEKEEAKADAQLIATAPEMLKRLKSVQLSLMVHPDYVSGENQEFIDQVNSIEETINKALGKEESHV